MTRDQTVAIRDCLVEIDVLIGLAERSSLAAFKADPISRRAAAYSIQCISEAVRHIPDAWLAEFPHQPWNEIKRTGNRIRHDYYRLDDGILWRIMTLDAPALKTDLETMLRRHTPG